MAFAPERSEGQTTCTEMPFSSKMKRQTRTGQMRCSSFPTICNLDVPSYRYIVVSVAYNVNLIHYTVSVYLAVWL